MSVGEMDTANNAAKNISEALLNLKEVRGVRMSIKYTYFGADWAHTKERYMGCVSRWKHKANRIIMIKFEEDSTGQQHLLSNVLEAQHECRLEPYEDGRPPPAPPPTVENMPTYHNPAKDRGKENLLTHEREARDGH